VRFEQMRQNLELNEMIFSHEEGKLKKIFVKKQVEIRPYAGGKELFESNEYGKPNLLDSE